MLDSPRVADEVFGFHCQQAVEKLLKALLAAVGVGFGRTHDLGHLMDLVSDRGHILPTSTLDLDRLTPYGTILRYDDPQDDAVLSRRETLGAIRVLRSHVEAVMEALPADS